MPLAQKWSERRLTPKSTKEVRELLPAQTAQSRQLTDPGARWQRRDDHAPCRGLIGHERRTQLRMERQRRCGRRTDPASMSSTTTGCSVGRPNIAPDADVACGWNGGTRSTPGRKLALVEPALSGELLHAEPARPFTAGEARARGAARLARRDHKTLPELRQTVWNTRQLGEPADELDDGRDRPRRRSSSRPRSRKERLPREPG